MNSTILTCVIRAHSLCFTETSRPWTIASRSCLPQTPATTPQLFCFMNLTM